MAVFCYEQVVAVVVMVVEAVVVILARAAPERVVVVKVVVIVEVVVVVFPLSSVSFYTLAVLQTKETKPTMHLQENTICAQPNVTKLALLLFS